MMHYRNMLALLHDIIVSAAAWFFAYWLRFNMEISALYIDGMLKMLLLVIPLQAVAFWTFGLYRGMWRYASVSDLQRILVAVGLTGLILAVLVFMAQWQDLVPRSVLILNPLLLVLAMGGSRFIYRAWKEHQLYGEMLLRGKPVLVLGAGDAAVSLLKELGRSEEWRVIGLLDERDDPATACRGVGPRVPTGIPDRWRRE